MSARTNRREQAVSLVAFTCCCSLAGAQEPVFRHPGASPDAGMGSALAFVGDLDGDGYVDFAVGSPGEGTVGRVEVLSGADGSALHSWSGVDVGGRFGAAVAGLGDIDGDSVPDVIAGAPLGGDHPGAGRACAFSGRTGGLLFNFSGGAAGDELGTAVAILGDVNGDGHADVALGAPGFDATGMQEAGCVLVRSGFDGSVLYSVIGAGRFGSALTATDDADGDGTGDWAVGAPLDNGGFGRIEHRSGATGDLLFGVDGNAAEDFGYAVGRIGDVDGDGRGDIVIGFPGHDGPAGVDSGKVAVCSALGTSLGSFLGTAPGERLGTVVGPAGDFDKDGIDDVLSASPSAAGGSGKVVVCSVATGGALWSKQGLGMGFGGAAAGGVDLNAGGYPDVLVGEPGWSASTVAVGRAQLFTPRDLHFTSEQTCHGLTRFLARGGGAGRRFVFVLTGLDGQPVWIALASGQLSSSGEWSRQLLLPGFLPWEHLTFSVVAVDAPGTGLQVSNPVTVALP